MWELNYGGRVELLEHVAKTQNKLPSALANRPEPSRAATPYLSAFKRLHSSRMIGPNGMPSGIPLSEIEAYARMFGFNDLEDRFDLMHFVRVCDDVYLEHMRKQKPKAPKVGNSGKHTPRRR